MEAGGWSKKWRRGRSRKGEDEGGKRLGGGQLTVNDRVVPGAQSGCRTWRAERSQVRRASRPALGVPRPGRRRKTSAAARPPWPPSDSARRHRDGTAVTARTGQEASTRRLANGRVARQASSPQVACVLARCGRRRQSRSRPPAQGPPDVGVPPQHRVPRARRSTAAARRFAARRHSAVSVASLARWRRAVFCSSTPREPREAGSAAESGSCRPCEFRTAADQSTARRRSRTADRSERRRRDEPRRWGAKV